jgi:Flp pilus assembly protein CpaB
MSTIQTEYGSGQLNRFLWALSFKNRKILIMLMSALILVAATLLTQKFIAMDLQLKKLSRYEPIYVLGLKRDLNIGDVISRTDLKPIIFYKEEYAKQEYAEGQSSYFKANYNSNTHSLSGLEGVLGRVVKTPIFSGSMLREEQLAPVGTLPGLINLIEENHSLLDVSVPQKGFNVFIKPNDLVDLFQVNKTGSKLLASKVKVILVDSEPLGKAPMRVTIDDKSKRQLTISVPEQYFSNISQALKENSLVVTYKNKDREEISNQSFSVRPNQSLFQSLLMIQGPKKELFAK